MKKVFNENKRTEPMEVAVNTAFAGRVKMEVHRDHGESRGVVAEFDNMILDSGLRMLLGYKEGTAYDRCYLGSSSAPVTPEQVKLTSPIPGADAYAPYGRNAIVGGDPFLATRTWSFEFSKGKAAGVIAELGFSPDGEGNLFSRALVRDDAGDPTTITVADDEFLTVTYVLSMYIDVSDKPFTLNLSSGAHDGILRPTDLRDRTVSISMSPSLSFYPSGYFGTGAVLGEVDSTPSGSQRLSISDYSRVIETSDSLVHRDTLLTIPLSTDATQAGGIHVLTVAGSPWGCQMSFDPPIPKTGENVFSFRFRYSVGRR